jgi:hypothetical protein
MESVKEEEEEAREWHDAGMTTRPGVGLTSWEIVGLLPPAGRDGEGE